MIPEYFPVLTADDIIEPPPKEYEAGEVRSTVGWLKHLFLFQPCEDKPDCIQITTEDRKDFKNVLDKFRIVNKMKKGENIDEWEETASRKKQASALNKLRKAMGYTEIIEV